MKIGDKAIPFCLPDGDGNAFCLKDAKNKWIILYFYPKDDTPGCTLEAIDFTHAIDQFFEAEALVVGISPDSKQSHCNFRDKYNLKVTLISDVDHRIMEAYGVWVQKKLYGKSFFGVERTTFLIDPKGKIQAVWHKVKVAGHIEAVLATLKQLRSVLKT